jgi:NTE family protein
VPDVLVLAGGGVLGEAWMSALLAGVEAGAGIDFRRAETFVGTSAGAIVAASLSGGRRPSRPTGAANRADEERGPEDAFARAAPDSQPERAPRTRDVLREAAARRLGAATAAAGAPLAPAALALGAPAGALVRALVLAGLPEGTRSLSQISRQFDRAGARFDGRLRVCAVDRASGRRVVFGAPGAPAAGVGEAVAASCAIPGVFHPVLIGGRAYVDGGVWSPTNLDAATVGRETEVLCLNPTGSLTADPVAPLGLVRTAFRTAEALELTTLRRRGARVRIVSPDERAAALMGTDLMASGPRERVARAGYRQGLALAGGG